MKRILSLFTALVLLSACLPAAAEEAGIVVKNYRQLVSAVNEQQETRILISAKYKHSTEEIINLRPDGRIITILPANGESAVINGRVDITGPGSVIFRNVTIAGPEGDAGLWIGGGADVTAGRVKGGKAKKETSGCPAVIVSGGRLAVDTAIGSDGKSGFGGDGIYAFGESTVKVRDASGGSASKGFGGSGVVVFGGAKVTVTGSAKGGDGLYAPGRGVLAGLDGAADGAGTLTDGSLLEGKRTRDPETVNSRVTLEHAFRSGRTEILLSPDFRAGTCFPNDLFVFTASEEPVRIANASEGRPASVDCPLYFHSGTWTLEDIRFSLKSKSWAACLWAGDSADVTASGSMAARGEACGVFASGRGKIRYTGDCSTEYYAAFARDSATVVFDGNISESGRTHFAAGCEAGASVTVNGNIRVSSDACALACFGGELTIAGSVQASKNLDCAAVYITGGGIVLNGPLNCEGQGCAIRCRGGSVTVNGDVTGMTRKKHAVELTGTAGDIVINGTLTAARTAVEAGGGSVTVSGDLVIISREDCEPFSCDSESGASVTVGGETRITAP